VGQFFSASGSHFLDDRKIIKNQDPSGGFPYRFTPNKFGFINRKKTANYCYSSWELMETDIYQSDTWGYFSGY
jgi:hypothetical protein